MKILISGFGSIGRRHFRNLKTLGVEDFVFHRTGYSTLPDDAITEIAAYPVESDLQVALSHHPDAVVVANPTALHLDTAIPAIEAGCHLFLEKPISHSLRRVEQLQAAVAQSDSRVLVGFQFRFHPGLCLISTILDQLADSNTQSVVYVRAHWGEYLPDWHPWEDYRQGYAARSDLGGGVILTLCHPFDYLRWLFGEYEVACSSTSRRGLGMSVEDTAEINLQFTSGVIGSMHLDYIQRPSQHTLEIVVTNGTIRWDNADGAVRVYADGHWLTHPAPDGFERNVMFLDQMRHFLAICRGEAEPICTLNDGIAALRLSLDALSRSAESK